MWSKKSAVVVACLPFLAFEIDLLPFRVVRHLLQRALSLPEALLCTPRLLWLLGLEHLSKVEGKSVVITGAASGIGRALAVRLAQLGWSVLACDVNEEALQSLAKQENIAAFRLDVADARQCKSLSEEVARRFPSGLSALANVAGIARPAPLLGCTDEEVDLSLRINVAGPVRLMRLLMPSLLQHRGGGTVLNMSSTNGMDTWPWSGAYPVTKHALEAASDSVRREALANGLPLKVVIVEPGPVNTPLSATMPAQAVKWCTENERSAWVPAMRRNAERSDVAMKRLGRIPFRLGYEASEVAEVCAIALSSKCPRARYVCCRGPFLWLWWLSRFLPEEIADAIMCRV